MKKAFYLFYFITVLLYALVVLPVELHGFLNFDLTDNGHNALWGIYFLAHLLFIDKALFIVFIICIITDIRKHKKLFVWNFVSLVLVLLVDGAPAYDLARSILWIIPAIIGHRKMHFSIPFIVVDGANLMEFIIAIVMIIKMIVYLKRKRS